MNAKSTYHAAAVLGAGLLMLGLAGSLVLRAAGRSETPGARPAGVAPKGPVAPSAGLVPEPRPIAFADVPRPLCWSCPGNLWLAADFQLDLDLLAPLGDGPSNVALWLRRFARTDGDRFLQASREDMVDARIAGKSRKVLPGSHALLSEAEPWLDQARCSFYPEIWRLDGPDTPIPNLLFVLDLARSFVARGLAAETPSAARDDFRRVIRLGRLLRQDDATIIQDLIGIECIRLGAWALNEQAREQGDALLLAATNGVLSDHDSLRARTALRVRSASRVYDGLRTGFFGGIDLELSEFEVDEVKRLAMSSPERRFRLEALIALRAIYQLGDSDQRASVEDDLRTLSNSEDPDVAAFARRALESPFAPEELELLGTMGESE